MFEKENALQFSVSRGGRNTQKPDALRNLPLPFGARGSAVVKALCCEAEGRDRNIRSRIITPRSHTQLCFPSAASSRGRPGSISDCTRLGLTKGNRSLFEILQRTLAQDSRCPRWKFRYKSRASLLHQHAVSGSLNASGKGIGKHLYRPGFVS
jgi:hypothetical protein